MGVCALRSQQLMGDDKTKEVTLAEFSDAAAQYLHKPAADIARCEQLAVPVLSTWV